MARFATTACLATAPNTPPTTRGKRFEGGAISWERLTRLVRGWGDSLLIKTPSRYRDSEGL